MQFIALTLFFQQLNDGVNPVEKTELTCLTLSLQSNCSQ